MSHRCCLKPDQVHDAGVRAGIDSEKFRQQDLKTELDDLMAASRAPLPGTL